VIRQKLDNISDNPSIANVMKRNMKGILNNAKDISSLIDAIIRVIRSGININYDGIAVEYATKSVNRIKYELKLLASEATKDQSSKNGLRYVDAIPVNSLGIMKQNQLTVSDRYTEVQKDEDIVANDNHNENDILEKNIKIHIEHVDENLMEHNKYYKKLNEKAHFETKIDNVKTKVVENELPERLSVTLSKVVRNQKIVEQIKQIYNNRCQICDTSIWLGEERYYSEAHHICPLGEHCGSDTIDNMIALCPNHHVMFDKGVLTIDLNMKIAIFKDSNNPLNNSNIIIKHKIDNKNVQYHNDYIFYKRKTLHQSSNKAQSENMDTNYGRTVYVKDMKNKEKF
jgi:predicted restriction endonuclease